MTFYLGRNRTTVTHMKSYLIYLTCKIYLQSRYFNVSEREQGKYLAQTRSQAKSSGITLPEVHGVDKGFDQNKRLEKKVINPITSSEAKSIFQIKPRLGQVRAGIKQKTINSRELKLK